jgi:hypothetical protein
MNDQKNYLRIFGIHKVKISEVKKNEFKGKVSLNVTFEDEMGRIIDARFKMSDGKTLDDISKNQMKSLMKACEVERPGELKEKNLIILVHPNDYQGKTFWNASKFLSAKLEKYIGKDGNDVNDVFDMGDIDSDLGISEPKVEPIDEPLPF